MAVSSFSCRQPAGELSYGHSALGPVLQLHRTTRSALHYSRIQCLSDAQLEAVGEVELDAGQLDVAGLKIGDRQDGIDDELSSLGGQSVRKYRRQVVF